MNTNDLATLLDHLDGRLAGDGTERLRRRLEKDAALKRDLDHLSRLVECVRVLAHPSFPEGFPDRVNARIAALDETRAAMRDGGFAPGFADRVMARVEPEMAADRQRGLTRSREVEVAIPRVFTRLLPAAAAVVILLGTFSLRAGSDDQTAIEAMLGLEPVTLEAAYEVQTIGMQIGGAP